LKVAYFAQHQLDELNPAASPYDHVRALMPGASEAQLRARAGALGFPGAQADTPAAKLSGGEKARLLLGLATFAGPHLVVLDEPTNHLDIDSRAALIEAINDYPGAVVLVSHDRYLIEACADRLWLVADGGVAPFDGDLDDYRKLVLAGRREDSEGDKRGDSARQGRSDRAEERRRSASRRTELAPLRRQIAQTESAIQRHSARLAEIDRALADPSLYASEPARAAALNKERAELSVALAKAEELWLTLSSDYENAFAE